jgi:hypothetical protein
VIRSNCRFPCGPSNCITNEKPAEGWDSTHFCTVTARSRAAAWRYRSDFARWLIHVRIMFWVKSCGSAAGGALERAEDTSRNPIYLCSGEAVGAKRDSVMRLLQWNFETLGKECVPSTVIRKNSWKGARPVSGIPSEGGKYELRTTSQTKCGRCFQVPVPLFEVVTSSAASPTP